MQLCGHPSTSKLALCDQKGDVWLLDFDLNRFGQAIRCSNFPHTLEFSVSLVARAKAPCTAIAFDIEMKVCTALLASHLRFSATLIALSR
jgi:hypothetical protein